MTSCIRHHRSPLRRLTASDTRLSQCVELPPGDDNELVSSSGNDPPGSRSDHARSNLVISTVSAVVMTGIVAWLVIKAIYRVGEGRDGSALFWLAMAAIVARPSLKAYASIGRLREGRPPQARSTRAVVISCIILGASGTSLIVIGLTAYRNPWIVASAATSVLAIGANLYLWKPFTAEPSMTRFTSRSRAPRGSS